MVIAKGIDVRLGVFDIETLRECFDFGLYDPDRKEWHEFQISKDRNDLYSFIKFYTEKRYDYYVSFNGIGFDHQVLQYILDNYNQWYDLDNLGICAKIYEFVQKIIDDQNYSIQPPYTEKDFPHKVIDLFKIHHFDNKQKRVSLKWCAYMMNMDVEEMPIHHSTVGMTDEQIAMINSYKRNDILVTLGLLYLTLGQVDKIRELNGNIPIKELEDEYNGKNKIQDRFDVYNETGMHCLNFSDVKIGEEWNKKDYKEAENITNDNLLFPTKVVHPYGKKFKKFFPHTLSFQTDQLKSFIEELGECYVKNEKQEFPIKIGNTTYTIAKGGLHSTEKNRHIVVPQGFRYRDIDVGSQYPNSIVKYRIFAPHLIETILKQFVGKIDKRFLYKDLAKELIKQGRLDEAHPYSSIQETLKLCLNGGYYGKLGQEGSFLEYPEGLLKVCIGNQIEILMLIEEMELKGFNVMSGNTDGITVMYPIEKEEEFLQICKWWEDKVGNSKMGKLEHTIFTEVWQESVNHYIAKKEDGSAKKKGRFATSFKLEKNKGPLIIPLAMEQYFIYGKNPIDYIMNHTEIHDFCMCKKGTRKLYYDEIVDDDTVIRHDKIVRYFISNNGRIIKKRGIDKNDQYVDSYVQATNAKFFWLGQPLCTVFNKYTEQTNYDINYNFYIIETLSRIDKIEKTDKAKKYADKFKTKQTSLF